MRLTSRQFASPPLAGETWRLRDWLPPVVGTIAATLVGLTLRAAGVIQPWELHLFDQFTQRGPVESFDERILLVEINDKDLRRL